MVCSEVMELCVAVCVWSALRIHISKPCYIGLLEIGGYEMTLRGEMNVKVHIVYAIDGLLQYLLLFNFCSFTVALLFSLAHIQIIL